MMSRARVVITTALGLTVAAVALAAAAPSILASRSGGPASVGLQKDVDALVTAGAPGVILLVRDGNQTVHLTSGFADVATKTAMRPGDRFKIASLTKSYTATVVLQLVGEGKLRLSDNVEQWLPGVVPNGSNITIHQLLNHTSGIFSFEKDPRVLKPYQNGNLGYYWAPRKLVSIAVSHKPLFRPGAHNSYSSTNYVLAGLIVEAVTGKTIGGELTRRIFQPLHLRSTTFPTKPGLQTPYAHGYYVPGKPPALDVSGLSPSLSPASGAIVSTAVDVADFYRALLSGHLLKPNQLSSMEKTVSQGRQVDIAGQRYGLGLERFPTSCGIAWGHNGDVAGYFSFAFTSPDGARQAVLMVNEDAGSLPKRAAAQFLKLIKTAYCSTS